MTQIDLIEEKIKRSERLSREEGLYLLESKELLRVGQLAHTVKVRKSGEKIFFNTNRHINLTNICSAKCKLCAFCQDAASPKAYVMTKEEVLSIARQAVKDAPELTELHIVSALHPDKPFSYYVDILESIHQEFPKIHLKAFTAEEINHFAKLSGKNVAEVFAVLKKAGLKSLPGGGAEILNDRVRNIICKNKSTASEWLATTRTAHLAGILTNATMLYGHVETKEERIDHLITLRELQDETGGFQSFIPFPFHPDNTGLAHIKRGTAWEDLKIIALSRLMLDNFAHVKAFWIMLTVPIAQLALAFGADDLDGTVVEEKIIHTAGAKTALGITKEELIKLIRQSGHVPVERDTVYGEVKVY